MAGQGTIMNVPFQLRGNDVQRHIINVDSRFRDAVEHSTSANFYVTLPSPIRNILRIRITSFEFPNNYYMFTSKRQNTTFQVIHTMNTGAVAQAVTIPDGSYTACELESTLQSIFSASGSELQWLSVKFDPIQGHFVFTGKKRFAIDTLTDSFVRPFDYGLGYYMGFTRDLHKSNSSSATTWTVESDCQANFAGDSYLLLRLNDYFCVSHSVEGSCITAFAKFILKEPKNNVAFDDYSGHHIKEVVFTTPQDLARIKIQLLDPYGQVLDIGCNNYSFSLEILEIKNSSLYDTIRNSLQTAYI